MSGFVRSPAGASPMRGQNNNGRTDVIPSAHAVEQADRSNNQLDEAGQAILQLLGRAADIAEGNNRQAIDKAQKLSHQLHAAEDRIRELEAKVASLRERADHAAQWLLTVHKEIEDRFLRQNIRQTAKR
jgi:hypothetical protein